MKKDEFTLENILGINELPSDQENKNDNKEYFTVIYQGKECKCSLFAKELIPDLEGNLYAQGYMWDGERNQTIRLYLGK